MNKVQSEDGINAELRDLARRIRELRSELKSHSSSAPPYAEARDQRPKTTQPIDEDRKLRPLPTRRRRRA